MWPLGLPTKSRYGPSTSKASLTNAAAFAGRARVEDLLDAVRDDVDPRVQSRELAQDLALGGVRDGDHARRGAQRAADHQPGVEARQPAVLARRQVDDVVDRHHRRAGQAHGKDVVRRVVEIEALLPRLRGERGQLAEGVASGALRHQPDPIARGEQPLVAGAVEEDPLDRAVEAHEAVHEVAHVRADAVVGRLAGVDADAHATRPPLRPAGGRAAGKRAPPGTPRAPAVRFGPRRNRRRGRGRARASRRGAPGRR